MARNKFDIDEELEARFDAKQLRRLLGYLKPYRGKVAFTVVLMITTSLLSLLGAYLVKVAIDDMIPAGNIGGMFILALIFIATLVFNTICMKYRIRTMSNIGQSIIYNIREDIFRHIQQLPFAYYDSRPHGKILVRVVNYVNSSAICFQTA